MAYDEESLRLEPNFELRGSVRIRFGWAKELYSIHVASVFDVRGVECLKRRQGWHVRQTRGSSVAVEQAEEQRTTHGSRAAR